MHASSCERLARMHARGEGMCMTHGRIEQASTMEWALEQRRVDTPDHDLGTVGVLRDGPRFIVVCHHQPLHKLD